MFIVGIYVVIVAGLLRSHPVAGAGIHVAVPVAAAVGVLLVLKAFAAGCSALTGVEAIANDVTAFREPKVRRAMRTEVLLGGSWAPCCSACRSSPSVSTSRLTANHVESHLHGWATMRYSTHFDNR